MGLPELTSVEEIRRRLEAIFPEGTTDRGYFVRELAAKVIYTMLYCGAMEGDAIWIGPKQVYRMSDAQMTLTDETVRREYGLNAWSRRFAHVGDPWYADTSREPIRDETLRVLVRTGAVIERPNLPTTSSKPRYALSGDFGELFVPSLAGQPLSDRVGAWQKVHLAAHALARVELVRQRMASGLATVEVTLPHRGVRHLAPGLSGFLSKAVIEEFAPRFLYSPTVLLLSESRKKVVELDVAAMKMIGLEITPARILPDIVLFDAVPDDELLVFVEVVATDGPVTLERRKALLELVPSFSEDRVAFVTAYADRASHAFRKTIASVAWESFVWFASEPDHVMILRQSTALEERRVFDLLRDDD